MSELNYELSGDRPNSPSRQKPPPRVITPFSAVIPGSVRVSTQPHGHGLDRVRSAG